MTWPLPTVSIIKETYDELSKVFEGQNRVTKFNFRDETFAQDFSDYRETINEKSFWTTDAWKLMQTNVNSIIAIDLPVEQEGTLPEPRFFVININHVHCLAVDPITNDMKYLVWMAAPSMEEKEQGIAKIAYIYDSASYRRANKRNDVWTIDVDVPHDLGYTPARMLWTDKQGNSTFRKLNPHGRQLGDLDWLLFKGGLARNLEIYAGFPIVTTYAEACNYKNSDGFACEDGWVDQVVTPGTDSEPPKIERVNCPACSNRELVGAGSVKEIPAPIDNQDADLMPAVNITQGDVESLKWMEDSYISQVQRFKASVIGGGAEPKNDQAKNEKQVQGDFEKKQNVLANLAGQFEKIQKFTLDTIALLRYGRGQYMGSVISYGNKFFLQSEQETLENYTTAKDTGLPNYMLNQRRQAITQKQFKNDPDMMTRVVLLDYLEPLPDYTVEEAERNKLTTREMIAFKANFNDLIKRFELENGDIVKWREGVELSVKIAMIEEKLKQYLEDVMPEEPEPVVIPAPGAPPAGSGTPPFPAGQ